MLSLVVPNSCSDSQTIEASYPRLPPIMPQGYHTSLLGVTQSAPHGPRGIFIPGWTGQQSRAAFLQLDAVLDPLSRQFGIRSHDQYAMESAMYNGTTGPPGWVKRYL